VDQGSGKDDSLYVEDEDEEYEEESVLLKS
jgi:hypothetical protein